MRSVWFGVFLTGAQQNTSGHFAICEKQQLGKCMDTWVVCSACYYKIKSTRHGMTYPCRAMGPRSMYTAHSH